MVVSLFIINFNYSAVICKYSVCNVSQVIYCTKNVITRQVYIYITFGILLLPLHRNIWREIIPV